MEWVYGKVREWERVVIGDEKVKVDYESEWRGRVEDKNIGVEVRELSR